LKARGRQRSDSTRVLANIRTLTRLILVIKTLRHALNDLAEAAPDWLAARLDPVWGDRSAVRVEEDRLPKDATLCRLLVETVSQDGHARLTPPVSATHQRNCCCAMPSSLCVWSGFGRTMVRTTCASATPQTCRPMPDYSPRRMMSRHALPPGVRPREPATRRLRLKPVTRTARV
jgi:hypothetical protein